MRLSFLLLALLAAAPLFGDETTRLVPGAASQLVLEGSSNVAGWRCRGTTLDARVEVAAALTAINHAIDRIEDGDIARWKGFPQPTFQLRIPVSTLRCGNRRMERDMYRALRSEAHPAIEFRFQELIGGVNHDIDGGSYHARVAGVLSLAGQTKKVAIDVEARRVSRDRFRLQATLPLRMTDFSITPPTALFGAVKARNELVVTFDLFLQPGAER